MKYFFFVCRPRQDGAIEKKNNRREEIIKLSRRSSTFGVILGIGGQVVISGKQQQLHSYNSSKCINDHRQDDQGKVLEETSRRHVAPRRLTTPKTVAQKDKIKKKRLGEEKKKKKKNSSHSFCHTKPAVPSGWEGQSSTVSTKVLPPSLFPPRGEKKSSHFMSTVLQK